MNNEVVPGLAAEFEEVKHWTIQFEELHTRLVKHFHRAETRQTALDYLKGLLSPVERKNSWQLAEQAGQKRPDAIQRGRDTAKWEAAAVRDELRQYVVEQMGEPGAVLVSR